MYFLYKEEGMLCSQVTRRYGRYIHNIISPLDYPSIDQELTRYTSNADMNVVVSKEALISIMTKSLIFGLDKSFIHCYRISDGHVKSIISEIIQRENCIKTHIEITRVIYDDLSEAHKGLLLHHSILSDDVESQMYMSKRILSKE